MNKLLLPIDGSEASQRSLAYVIKNKGGATAASAAELHLLNVQSPLSSG